MIVIDIVVLCGKYAMLVVSKIRPRARNLKSKGARGTNQ